MRIAIVNEHFTGSMGYLENLLPKALARLGHEVHVITGNLHVYHNTADYAEVYEPFLGSAVQPTGVEEVDGFLLHRIGHRMLLGRPALPGLTQALCRVSPDVVQTLSTATWVTMQAALNQPRRGFALFTGAHQSPSMLPRRLLRAPRWAPVRLASDIRRAVPGRAVAKVTERCFAVSQACAEVAVEFYAVPEAKIEISTLGSDTERFFPIESERHQQSRRRLRAELGFDDDDVVCIYTGRFTPGKDPLCLARAIAALEGQFHGLFVGGGPQADAIASHRRCHVRPFVPWSDLPAWYRAADVGVWLRQESISMLDAAACGLPVIAGDGMGALETIEGYGLTYEDGNARDLAAVLHPLRDPRLRAELGRKAVHAIRKQFSWEAIAGRRAARYEEAARRHRTRAKP